MAATRQDITRWFENGKAQGYTHMIVICDTYEWDDFPRYILADAEGARIAHKENDGVNMQKVMEVYNLSKPLDEQINRVRCFEY